MNKTEDLKKFLTLAAANGYGNETATKRRETDGSDTIEFTDGARRFHDNYFTSADGRRFYGREVVFNDNKPEWFLGYAGFVHPDAEPGKVYAFLKQALLKPDATMPIRGPIDYLDEDWHYTLQPSAGLEEFFAVERIFYRDSEVYMAYLNGGIIN